MHELPITESILEIAVRHAEQVQATRVTDLYLVIGQLASVIDESIQFYWDIISQGTICQGARLHFTRITAVLCCLDCGHTYTLAHDLELCPRCSSAHIRITAGNEFRLDTIRVVEAAASISNTFCEK